MQFYKLPQTGENKNGFLSCSPRLFSNMDTLHQPDKAGKEEGKMTQEIIQFIHTDQGVLMWNETGRGVHDHHSLFKQ
jgi:hypothetical protein